LIGAFSIIDGLNRDQRKSKVTHPAKNAVQRRLIYDQAGE
jgi:hypothetical protein